MKEETVSTAKISILLLAIFYVLAGLTALSCIFYLLFPSTYQFETTNIFEKISLCLKTTHIHLAIHVWYGIITTLALTVIFVYIVSVISIFTNEFSFFDDFQSYNTDGFFQMLENLFTTYPTKSVAVSDWQTHLFCAIATSGMTYLAYRGVQWYNKPVKRLRIQI
jgi:hypothetical protein